MKATHSFQNPNINTEERIANLLSLMTLAEKARQLDIYSGTEFNADQLQDFTALCREASPGGLQWRSTFANARSGEMVKFNNKLQSINLRESRLPIPVLFSEEALHGLIWPNCSVFPQPIALAASFEPELAKQTGRAIAKECRSQGIHEIWGPVLDLARDPRWGRVDEAYGEDSYLAARFAEQMIWGLQGRPEEQLLKNGQGVISEVKHFSGYGTPCGGLNCAPATIGPHEHAMYFLPVFEAAFQAGAFNAMCSYSSIDGIPVAADHQLLTETLRTKFGMRGFVRADMTAMAMLHSCHFVAESKEAAILLAIEAGVDVQLYDFPHDFYQQTIINLVESGKLPLETLNEAVRRVLRVKFCVGLFEQPFADELQCATVVRCQEHLDLAQKVAEKSICLLKNELLPGKTAKTLPLSKGIKSIAVLGPSAATLRWGGYSAPLPSDASYQQGSTLLDGIRNVLPPDTTIRYEPGCRILDRELRSMPSHWLWHTIPDQDGKSEAKPGLLGEYYNGHDFAGAPVLRRSDSSIRFQWIFSKVGEGVDDNCFAVRWTGQLKPDQNLRVNLGVSGRDSVRIYLNAELVLERRAAELKKNSQILLEAGESYDFCLELINDERAPRVTLGFATDASDLEQKALALIPGSEAVILAMGDDDESCGENFDRSDLNLPGQQPEFVRRIFLEAESQGIPVILVLQNGRPISLEWEEQHLAAIVVAWFGGERAGQAIAGVLFGDVNPAGRLPLSFPRSVGQLPVHYNRKPFGAHKYVEMDWEPLFPFGYGLSYSTFSYRNIGLSHSEAGIGELCRGNISVSVEVENCSECAGEEVVQLYLHDSVSSVVRPYKELCGFRRIALQPGQNECVIFTLSESSLRLLNRDWTWVVEPGEFELMIGPNSEDIRCRARLLLHP